MAALERRSTAKAGSAQLVMTHSDMAVSLAPQSALELQMALAPDMLSTASLEAPHMAPAPHIALLPSRTEALQVVLAPHIALFEETEPAPHMALSENTEEGSKDKSTSPLALS